ncbi:MAG TPA: tetratricopeptide repeat protein [Xanthomonadaceae bacterium]|nr:tetratricopeptide repeat protein [Xanthomonadaceae bacterium]
MSLDQARRAFLAGDLAQVLTLTDALLAGNDLDTEARSLRANAHIKSGQLDAAIEDLEVLQRQLPEDPRFQRALATTLNARGSRRLRAGDLEHARHDLMDALVLLPEYAPAMFNLALLFQAQNDDPRAVQTLTRLLEISPDDTEARLLLAELLLPSDMEAAARWLTPIPDNLPDDLRLRAAKVAARASMPRLTLRLLHPLPPESGSAVAALEAARELACNHHLKPAREISLAVFTASGEGRHAPGLRGLLQAHLSLPPVPEDQHWVDHAREGFQQGLSELHRQLTPARLSKMAPSFDQLVWSNFLLAYHGRDDRELQENYGRLVARCLTTFRPTLMEAIGPGTNGRRIGFVGSCFRNCTAGHYFGAWPRALSEAGYDVSVFQLGPRYDEFTDRFAAGCSSLARWDEGLDALADTLHEAAFDLIIYPELGMDMRVIPLASLRLARRQACAWGHPVTSGLPNIDAMLSCAEMEPADAQFHYSERLHLLPGIGSHYLPPPAAPPRSREDLGLPAERVLGLFPQSPFKIHPDNDAVLGQIAAAVPDLTWVLFGGESPGMTHALRSRVERALESAGANPALQLRILPLTDRPHYLAVNRACDFMLDTLHWSGGNTSLDALASGLPILTCPGRFMRGRQSAAMLRLIGMDELIHPSPEGLAEAAIALAGDAARRRQLRSTIDAHKDALFQRDDALLALPETIETMLAG